MLVPYLVLTVIAFLLDAVIIILHSMGKLPFGLYDFIFVLILLLSIALYRPRYIFWLFIATLPLETIILSPAELPISLRPFQILGAILIVATLILAVFRKLEFKLVSIKKICVVCQLIDARKKTASQSACCGPVNSFGFFDRIVFILPVFALIAIYLSPVPALAMKQSLVLISFVALYWLARNYLQSNREKFEAIWFLLVGTKAVILFGIYQAIAFKLNWPHFEVMPGRVNSTFTEPDWLGMFAVFAIALMLWVKLYSLKFDTNIRVAYWKPTALISIVGNIFLFSLLFLLLLTVARSAWLAMIGMGMVYLFLIVVVKGDMLSNSGLCLRRALFEGSVIVAVGILSLFVIEYYSLSSFHFLNRAASSVSGKQKITISCTPGSSVPEEITSVEELPQYNCRHINLEEIETEKAQENEIKEVLRPDPNVEIRKNIYATTWQHIKKQPLFGYGLGSASFFLGQDERGAGLNTSNIFLESWFTMGLAGLLITLALLIIIPVFAFHRLLKGCHVIPASFILLTSAAIVIPNLFNAGLLIGFFWIWLAVTVEMANQMIFKKVQQ